MLLGVLALAGCSRFEGGALVVDSARHDSAHSNKTRNSTARVHQVIDGDTIELRIKKKTEMVRLIGIDTPETVHPRKPVECFGPEASAYLSSLLPQGTEVQIMRDVEARDYYGRLLLYVFRADDDLFINLSLVTTGHAIAYPFEPNTQYSIAFARAAQDARKSGIGMWSACPR